MSHEQSRQYYDVFAESYEDERHDGYHRWLDRRTAALLQGPARDARVLEVGCGTGLLLREVAPVARTAVGLDLSHGMLHTAAERGLTVVEGSATQLPFPDAFFDLVYSFKVLAHVPDLPAALAEAARVTRPGGTLMLEFYNKRSIRYAIRRLRPAGQVGPDTDETHVYTRFHSLPELRQMLPADVRIRRVGGLRVATVVPQVFRLPGVGRVWERLEDGLSASPLRRFAGFLILELERL